MKAPIKRIKSRLLTSRAEAALIAGARDFQRVSGLTHNFYRYPARFSPSFVRAAIKAFSKHGDLVLDPYVGGGTTMVEAAALGRDGIGVDISELAEFVTKVKTTVYSPREFEEIAKWSGKLSRSISAQRTSKSSKEYFDLGYYKHLADPKRWRLRKAIEQAITSAENLKSKRSNDFARCVVLRTGQWALDGRKSLPSIKDFRNALAQNATDMIACAKDFRLQALTAKVRSKIRILNRSAVGIEKIKRFKSGKAPKLILTSPPYPGIHVLYHRWQVDGRKETAAPFWIANKLDGAGLSYYTMGDRKNPGLETYFENLQVIMESLVAVCSHETTIVQMVAFQDVSWQLPRYLETLKAAGLEEILLPSLSKCLDGRLWRSVPNRRWYSDQRGDTPGSKEVVLIHRKSRSKPKQPPQQSRTSVQIHL